jgi:hypothetical protein
MLSIIRVLLAPTTRTDYHLFHKKQGRTRCIPTALSSRLLPTHRPALAHLSDLACQIGGTWQATSVRPGLPHSTDHASYIAEMYTRTLQRCILVHLDKVHEIIYQSYASNFSIYPTNILFDNAPQPLYRGR